MAEPDLFQHDAASSPLILGVAANTPATAADDLFVIIPSFDPAKRWGPCPWQPHGATLPARGASCLIGFPADGPNPWVIAWT